MSKKNKNKNLKKDSILEPNLLVQKLLSSSFWSVLASPNKTFLITSDLFNFPINSAYLSWVQIYKHLSILLIRSFISNNYQIAFSSIQPKKSKISSSDIETIFLPTLWNTKRPILLFSMSIIINGLSKSNPKSIIGSLIVLFLI